MQEASPRPRPGSPGWAQVLLEPYNGVSLPSRSLEARSMSLSPLLAKQFSKPIQDKGRAYYFSGAVKLNTLEDDFAAGTVRGSQRYDVSLDVEGGTLWAYCSCPYVDQHLEPCKH